MERNYQTNKSCSIDIDELNWRTAFHEAGHAAAIHIENQQKRLPPVFFEILIKRPPTADDHFSAQVIDGNLIQNLPIAMLESFATLSGSASHSCQQAYEADVVNLLAGPLSEAKYIHLRDAEQFNFKLIDKDALHNYGGFSDLEKVDAYLNSFIAAKEAREEKMQELLAQAFNFIDNPRNWRCILNLAHHIRDSRQEIISCDEAIGVLDDHLYAAQCPPPRQRLF